MFALCITFGFAFLYLLQDEGEGAQAAGNDEVEEDQTEPSVVPSISLLDDMEHIRSM